MVHKRPRPGMILQVGFDHHSLGFFPSTNRRFVFTWGMWWFVGQPWRATFWTIHFEKPFLDITKLLARWKTWTFLSMSILQSFLNWAIHHNLRKHIHWRCQFEYPYLSRGPRHCRQPIPYKILVGTPSRLRCRLQYWNGDHMIDVWWLWYY